MHRKGKRKQTFRQRFIRARDRNLTAERSFRKKLGLWKRRKADWCFMCMGGELSDLVASDCAEMLLMAASSGSLTVALLFTCSQESETDPLAEVSGYLARLFPGGREATINVSWNGDRALVLIYLFDPAFCHVPPALAQFRGQAVLEAHQEIQVGVSEALVEDPEETPDGETTIFHPLN